MNTQELRKLAESYMPTFVGTVLHDLLDKIDQLQAELAEAKHEKQMRINAENKLDSLFHNLYLE